MKGDFSRSTFDRLNHYSRVLLQQGRVQLDPDWNEQVAILLDYLQALAADLIGPHGGPADNYGFGIVVDPGELSDEEQEQLEQSGLELEDMDFFITTGHYYVDGALCESDTVSTYTNQPDYPLPYSEELQSDEKYLVYLDVWERHITYIEDETIREVALGGPDTATRAKVVWQIKATDKYYDDQGDEASIPDEFDKAKVEEHWKYWLEKWQPEHRGALKAKAKEPEDADLADPCITDPEARYRGAENQLYRVEVHKDGPAWNGDVEDGKPAGNVRQAATFKWSRDNGSVVFPIRKLTVTTVDETTTTTVQVEHLGRDDRMRLEKGNWVEVVDDDYVLQRRAKPLLKVINVNENTQEVTLEGAPGSQVGLDSSKHPLLRRWDHGGRDSGGGEPPMADDGALLIQEEKWLTLENGVQVYFEAVPGDERNGSDVSHSYRTGDYWLIPARTATGDVEWPGPEGEPEVRPPHGVTHHYAPLAIISVGPDGTVTVVDCRYRFAPLGTPVS